MRYRTWEPAEYSKVQELRNSGISWGRIAQHFNTSKENARAAYRRAVGAKQGAYLPKHDAPLVAVLDIETLPMVVYTWGMYDQDISTEQVIADSCMLSWAGKYLNGSKPLSDIMTPEEARARDTERITRSVWEFLKPAHAVVGHNFTEFDFKYINTMFLKHGLPPLKFIIIDTLKIARQSFRFASNKMKYINGQLGIRNKVENDGFPLWRGCSEGDKKSLKTMLEYNEGDIGATEELFYKVRPYIHNFNVALYNEIEEQQCPVCGT